MPSKQCFDLVYIRSGNTVNWGSLSAQMSKIGWVEIKSLLLYHSSSIVNNSRCHLHFHRSTLFDAVFNHCAGSSNAYLCILFQVLRVDDSIENCEWITLSINKSANQSVDYLYITTTIELASGINCVIKESEDHILGGWKWELSWLYEWVCLCEYSLYVLEYKISVRMTVWSLFILHMLSLMITIESGHIVVMRVWLLWEWSDTNISSIVEFSF